MTTINVTEGKFDLDDPPIVQGADYTCTFHFTVAGVRMSLAGCTAQAQMRARPGGDLFADFVVDVYETDDVDDEDCGRIDISLEPADTAAIPRSGTWDLPIRDAGGEIQYTLYGDAKLRRRTTVFEDGS